ncbi:hypothetical protein D3C79_735670 [compost metagenome]
MTGQGVAPWLQLQWPGAFGLGPQIPVPVVIVKPGPAIMQPHGRKPGGRSIPLIGMQEFIAQLPPAASQKGKFRVVDIVAHGRFLYMENAGHYASDAARNQRETAYSKACCRNAGAM